MTMAEFVELEREDALLDGWRDPLQQQLEEADARISAHWNGLNKLSMGIGWDGYFIKRHDGWRRLHFEDEKHYRRAKGIGRSTWYKMTGIAERLQHLTRNQFLAMTIENAEQLSVQPLGVKHDPDLILLAQTVTAAEFADELVLDQAQRENKPVKDVLVTMKWRIRQGQRKVIERYLEDWCQEHGIDDEGYGLELALAELHERPTLVGFISDSIPWLTEAVTKARSVSELEGLRGLVAQHIQEMGEILKVCCGENEEDRD